MEWVELGRMGAPFGVKGWVHVDRTPTRRRRCWSTGSGRCAATASAYMRRVAEGRAHGEGLVARSKGSRIATGG